MITLEQVKKIKHVLDNIGDSFYGIELSKIAPEDMTAELYVGFRTLSYDEYYHYSDDPVVWRRGVANDDKMKMWMNAMSGSELVILKDEAKVEHMANIWKNRLTAHTLRKSFEGDAEVVHARLLKEERVCDAVTSIADHINEYWAVPLHQPTLLVVGSLCEQVPTIALNDKLQHHVDIVLDAFSVTDSLLTCEDDWNSTKLWKYEINGDITEETLRQSVVRHLKFYQCQEHMIQRGKQTLRTDIMSFGNIGFCLQSEDV